MKNVVYAAVRIEYDHNPNRNQSMEEIDGIALDLAISPNFNTVTNGVSLKSLNVLKTESFQPVNWNDLKYYPDEVYFKP